jgi:hypothetical protein
VDSSVVRIRQYNKVKFPAASAGELRDLATAIRNGHVFGSWDMKAGDEALLEVVFCHLRLRSQWRLKEEEYNSIKYFYGYLKDAVPNAANGYPMFLKFHALSETDYAHLLKML